MSERKIKETLVRVRWEDCRLLDTSISHRPTEVPGPIIGEDVGWLVRESKNDIAVGLQRYILESGERTFRMISVIPKRQVISIKRYRP